MYYSHYTIIKYMGFKPIQNTINVDVVSFFKVFNEFDYVFRNNKIISFPKKKKKEIFMTLKSNAIK